MEDKKQMIIVSGLIIDGDKILIAKRADDKQFYPGGWEFPGGGVEFGETPQDALKREILEEVHIEVEVKDPLHVFSYVTKIMHHDVEIVFLCHLKKGEVSINSEDHSDYQWVTPSEAIKFLDKDFLEESNAIRKYLEAS